MINQNPTIDMIPGRNAPVIHVDQYDTGTMVFTIQVDGRNYAGERAYIQGTKPSGATFRNNLTRGSNDATATWNVTRGILDEAGDTIAQIVLTDGERRTGSQRFILRVQETAYDNAEI